MSKFTKDELEVSWEIDGGGEQRKTEEHGMVIALESWKAGLDTTDDFKDLPEGACQEQHWGYVMKGQMTIRYTGGSTETISGGQAYYLAPGHNAVIDEDIDLVEFTPASQTPDQAPGTNLLG
jgi:hypothetical protein